MTNFVVTKVAKILKFFFYFKLLMILFQLPVVYMLNYE